MSNKCHALSFQHAERKLAGLTRIQAGDRDWDTQVLTPLQLEAAGTIPHSVFLAVEQPQRAIMTFAQDNYEVYLT